MGRNIEKSAVPVYVHSVYSGEVCLYIRHSFTADPDGEYQTLQEKAARARKEYSNWIRSHPPGEARRQALESQGPEELGWRFEIQELRPWKESQNDGSRRRKRLRSRLEKKAPLFAEELEGREIEADREYYTGCCEIDRRKAEARRCYTAEYWESYEQAVREQATMGGNA